MIKWFFATFATCFCFFGTASAEIEAIIFEMDHVVVDGPALEALNEGFSEIFHLDLQEVSAFFSIQTDFVMQGKITEEQMFANFSEHFAVSLPSDISASIAEWYAENSSVNGLVRRIVKKLQFFGYQAILHADTTPSRAFVNNSRGTFALFDDVILSYEIGTTKQYPEAFLSVKEKLHVQPEQILFISPDPFHCEIAESIGFDTILFTTAEELKITLLSRWMCGQSLQAGQSSFYCSVK